MFGGEVTVHALPWVRLCVLLPTPIVYVGVGIVFDPVCLFVCLFV